MSEIIDTRRSAARGIDTERVDRGALWRPVAAALVGGVIIGGAIGAGVGSAKSPSYEATTAITVLPDSVVDTGSTTDTLSLDATAYIQGQLVTINGGQVAATVQQRLALPASPDVTATQVGQTYVVDIVATADTQARADRIATATASVYDQLRTNALTQSIQSQQASTAVRLKTVQQNLDASSQGVKPNTAVTPAQTALQTEYERLLTLSSSLSLALPQVGQIVTVQSPAHATGGGVSSTLLYAALGALLGAFVALVAVIVTRRVRPRVRTVGELVDLDVPVLLPVLPRQSRRSLTPGRVRPSGPARQLAARLTRGTASRVLVVVGPTAGVGASHTAAGLAVSAATHGPVMLVLASQADERADERVDDTEIDLVASSAPGVWLLPNAATLSGRASYSADSQTLSDVVARAVRAGWFVVVDAPPLSESDLALDCLDQDSASGVLIAARGVSRPADVLAAADLLESRDVGFAGVVLNEVPSGLSAVRRPRRDAMPLAPREPEGRRGGAEKIGTPSLGAPPVVTERDQDEPFTDEHETLSDALLRRS